MQFLSHWFRDFVSYFVLHILLLVHWNVNFNGLATRLGKRELLSTVDYLLFHCFWSDSWCLAWVASFDCGIPLVFHITVLYFTRTYILYEPRYEKAGFLHMRKQRRRLASR